MDSVPSPRRNAPEFVSSLEGGPTAIPSFLSSTYSSAELRVFMTVERGSSRMGKRGHQERRSRVCC